tara:strand:+ start:5782 stop:6882 length:1101 start_codon:yes stop_codon:yes gene_type:complete
MIDESNKFNIFIQNDALINLKSFLDVKFQYINKLVLITDNIVFDYYENIINKLHAYVIVIPAGENSKSREMKAYIEDQMFELQCGRDTLILAFGGGVVTDLAGFVAATYCRGIPTIYIPTTLLAQIDASIGGKTGINTPYGKNLIGAFKQPEAVFIDPKFLNTLSDLEYYSAFAEIIKHSLICDKDYFNFILNNIDKAKNKDSKFLLETIQKSYEIKLNIVNQDEKERGLREILNFGHTIGHAIEVASNYTINHGQAVALGILAESYISCELKILSLENFQEIQKIINLYNINNILLNINHKLDKKDILSNLKLDKKSRANQVRFVLIQDIGKVYISSKNQYANVIDDSYISSGLDLLLEFFSENT